MLQRQKIAKVNVDGTLVEIETEEILNEGETEEITIEEIQNNVDSEIELMDEYDACFISLTFKKCYCIRKIWGRNNVSNKFFYHLNAEIKVFEKGSFRYY